MSVAKVGEISATSTMSSEDAIRLGIARAAKRCPMPAAPGSRSSAYAVTAAGSWNQVNMRTHSILTAKTVGMTSRDAGPMAGRCGSIWLRSMMGLRDT